MHIAQNIPYGCAYEFWTSRRHFLILDCMQSFFFFLIDAAQNARMVISFAYCYLLHTCILLLHYSMYYIKVPTLSARFHFHFQSTQNSHCLLLHFVVLLHLQLVLTLSDTCRHAALVFLWFIAVVASQSSHFRIASRSTYVIIYSNSHLTYSKAI